MTLEREQEIHREVWKLIEELRDLHTERTGHPVWTHRRPLDTASRCFECSGATVSERGGAAGSSSGP